MTTIKTLFCAILAGLALEASVEAAENTAPMAFSIQSQALQDALTQFGRQSGFQLLFLADITAEVTAPEVVGRFTPRDALEQLLDRTGLQFRFVNERTIAISRDKAGEGARTTQEAGTSDEVRLAGESNSAMGGNTADAADSQSTKLQEVVVTAQRRRERLQDVPISMSVLGGRELDRSNYVSVNDVLNVSVPGVATSYSAFPGTTQLSVRGVSAPQLTGSGASPIAYYIDSVPFGFVRSAIVPDVGSFDLQQVEALRGPQGTLYGANAVNGVVRVLTKDADLNNMEFKARTSVSSTEGGDMSYRGDVAINVPIIDDKLAARLTGSYANVGGWIDNLVKRDTNDTQLSDMRLKVNAKPVDNLSLGLSWWHSKTDIGAFGLANNNDVYPGIMDTPTTNRFDAIGFKVGYQFPGVSVSSATSYIDYKNHSNFDITPFNDVYGPFDPTWVGQVGFNKLDSKVFAQEVTLTSQASGSWRWTAGAFYRDAEDHYFSTAIYLDPPPNNPDNGDISKSFAGFGELTREFLNGKLELTGGLRYFRDQVTVTSVVPPQHDVDTFHHVSPRLILNWHPSSLTTAYVSYAEGFKGGFSQDASLKRVAPDFPPAKPDTLHNYEVGLKGELLGGRITYDSAAYYMDWQDVQQLLIVPAGVAGAGSVGAIVNGRTASGPGIDLNVMARPLVGLSGFELGLNVSWNDLTFDEDVLTDNQVLFPKGSRLAFSPEYTLGALAAYSFPLGESGLQSRLSISGSYHSKQITRGFGLTPGASLTYAGDDLLNVHAGFSLGAPERWTAELFVDNATNNRGNVFQADPFTSFYYERTRPRTIGLQVDYNFRK